MSGAGRCPPRLGPLRIGSSRASRIPGSCRTGSLGRKSSRGQELDSPLARSGLCRQ